MSIPGAASPLFFTTAAAADTGYKINRSLRFNDGDSAYLNKTPSSAGNSKTWTISFWVKRVKSGAYNPMIDARSPQNDSLVSLLFNSNDEFELGHYSFSSIKTSRKYRDFSSWYHIVLAVDTTQATASNRIKVYTNGVQETSFTTATYPAQDTSYNWNTASLHTINQAGGNYGSQYLAEIHSVDGAQLTADDFGEEDDNGVWQPKEFSGSYNQGGSGTVYSNDLTTNTGSFASGSSATDAFDGDTSASTRANAELSSDNYVEFEPTTPISFTNGVHVRCYAANGYSITNYYSVDLDGNGLGSETTFTGGSSGFNDVAWIQVATGSGTLHKVRIRITRGGGNTTSAGITAIAINGTSSSDVLVDGTPGGANGFYLKFADNSSNAALGTDSSGNSNTFTVNNLTAGGATPYAIDLDGNDKVTFPGVTIGTGDVTCECFFNLDTSSTSGFRRILSHTYGGSGNTLNMRVHNNGELNIVFDSTSYTGTTVTQGVWHHMAVVRSGSTVSFYYDGERKSTGTNSTDITLNNVILGWGNGSEYFPGQIHGARITKQALYSGTTYTVPTEPITTTSQGATASNVVHLSATTSSTTTNSGTTADGTDGGDPTVVTATPFAGSTGVDSMIDTPTNYTASSGNNGGNYATFNALMATSEFTYADGNLETSFDAGDNNITVSTIAPKSGKWYAEIVFTASGVANNFYGEVAVADASKIGQGFNSSTSTRYREGSADIYGAGTATGTKSDFAVDDVMGVAVDADNDTVYFYKNNTLEGTVTGLNFDGYAIGVAGNSGTNRTFTAVANFGQRPFTYTPPTGYVSLCTQNLADPTIADGSTAFDVITATGTAADRTFTMPGGFGPDFVWAKDRSNATNHALFDTVRGATKRLISNSRNDEDTQATQLKAFTSTGFTYGSDIPNNSSQSGVYWCWDAGTSTVSNTDGSITSSVRASASNGFSIVKYVGTGANASVGHGLSAAPDWIIFKDINRDDEPWFVYHSFLGSSAYLFLNTTAGKTTGQSDFMNSTDPTNSVFSLGNATGKQNRSGSNFLALCWTAVEGFSSFGTYTGNNSTDGPYVYTGFRPAWVMVKGTGSSNTYSWVIVDSTRSTYNPTDHGLFSNSTNVENNLPNYGDRDFFIDLLSNGFKLRIDPTSINTDGGEYIYAAFAEHPFKTARAR